MTHTWQVQLGKDNIRWHNEEEAELTPMKTLKALNMITPEKLKEFLNKCLQESVNSLKETSLEPHSLVDILN